MGNLPILFVTLEHEHVYVSVCPRKGEEHDF